jgi:outer membrane receptor protein involved in Fe transport
VHSKRLFCILMISVAWTPLVGGTTRSEEPEKFNLKIDSQPLGSALQEFARQSGVQIIFFSQVTEGFRSPAVNGQYTIANALQMLLAGSKLTFRIINSKTIEIRPLTATDPLNQSAGEGAKVFNGGSLHAQSSSAENYVECPFDSQANCVGLFNALFRTLQGSYVVASLRAVYEINWHWRVALNFNNLFDRIYYQGVGSETAGNWYGEPRNFMVRIDGRY